MTGIAWKVSVSLILALGGAIAFTESASYYPPTDKDGGWRTLAGAARVRATAGMDLSRLDQAFEFEKEASQHGGLVVVRHGYLVYERYFGKANREAHPDMASIGKAFTSVACGIMLKEKHNLIPDGLQTREYSRRNICPRRLPLDDPSKGGDQTRASCFPCPPVCTARQRARGSSTGSTM